MRKKMRPKKDKKIFRRTAAKSKKAFPERCIAKISLTSFLAA